MRSLTGHTRPVLSVAFSPRGGKWLLSGAADCTVRLWDTASGVCLRVLRGHTQMVGCVAFAEDGEHGEHLTVVSGGRDNDVRIWSLKKLRGEGMGWGVVDEEDVGADADADVPPVRRNSLRRRSLDLAASSSTKATKAMEELQDMYQDMAAPVERQGETQDWSDLEVHGDEMVL